MPYVGREVKAVFEDDLKGISPDVVFTHNREGRAPGPPGLN